MNRSIVVVRFSQGVVMWWWLACSDNSVKVLNSEPTATITAPADGDELGVGENPFRGVVGDPDGAPELLLTVWRLEGVEVCTTPADTEGNTACDISVPSGTVVVDLEVRDGANATGTDAVTVTGCEGRYFLDVDGDGFGDPLAAVISCDTPGGAVENDDDCDDANKDVSPAAAEACGDGRDDDCDGTVDEGCLGTNCGDDTDVIPDTHYFQTAGILRSTDALDDAGSYVDDFEFAGTAGQELAVHIWSEEVDAAVQLLDQDCEVYAEASDGARDANAFVQFRIPTDGIWTVVVRTDDPATLGRYVIELLADDKALGANCALQTATMDILTAPYADIYNGTISSSDQAWGADVGVNFWFDDVEFYSFYGDTVTLIDTSSELDAIVNLYGPDCGLETYATDGGGGTNAQIVSSVERTGIYTATPWAEFSGSTGAYTLSGEATW